MVERLGDCAVLAFDFLGFGLSEAARPSLRIAWQADLAEELVIRAGARGPVGRVAQGMGTSVVIELMARAMRGEQRIEVAGALLFNGPILLERASPTPAQRLLRSPIAPFAPRGLRADPSSAINSARCS